MCVFRCAKPKIVRLSKCHAGTTDRASGTRTGDFCITVDAGSSTAETTIGERRPMKHKWEAYGELNDQPVVEVDKLTRKPTTHCVIDSCPICGESHTHGFTEQMQRPMHKHANIPSHRSAHCGPGYETSGYHLIITDKTENAKLKDGLWQYNGEDQ